MKRLILLVLPFVAGLNLIQAQTTTTNRETAKILRHEKREQKKELKHLEGDDVADQSKSQFLANFGNIKDAAWRRSKYFDEVSFFNPETKLKTTAFYDDMSSLVGTTAVVGFNSLPERGRRP
ncbi:MAG: hypothetical protein E6Q58_05195 [Niabella sp.]|nr:MAG: hypothetical protein E6Q58_05195 [Niabella sp.]